MDWKLIVAVLTFVYGFSIPMLVGRDPIIIRIPISIIAGLVCASVYLMIFVIISNWIVLSGVVIILKITVGIVGILFINLLVTRLLQAWKFSSSGLMVIKSIIMVIVCIIVVFLLLANIHS